MTEVCVYGQVAGTGLSLGYDWDNGVTGALFQQGSAGIAGAWSKAVNLNFGWPPVSVEPVSMYLGVASPTGTPVLAVTALQNVQSGAPFLAAGLGLTDALEAGVCYEGTNGGGMNAGSPIFTVMGDFTGFYEDAPTRCFPAHTRIQTSRTTSTAISALRVGDVVLAFDARADKGRGALVPRRVARLYRNTTTEWICLRWVDGTAREGITTPGHHFLDELGGFPTIEEMTRSGSAMAELDPGAKVERSVGWARPNAHRRRGGLTLPARQRGWVRPEHKAFT